MAFDPGDPPQTLTIHIMRIAATAGGGYAGD
jgi:hypothetical protein